MAEICKHCNRPLSGPVDLPDPEKLLSLPEVANILGKPLGTLYRWRMMGKAPRGVKTGRSIGVKPSVLKQWMLDHEDDWSDTI